MDSVKNFEKIIEDAKDLLIEEKILVGIESTEEFLMKSDRLTKNSKALTSSKKGFILKNIETLKHKGALRRLKAPYYFFSAAFCIWIVLLLDVYLPIIGSTTPVSTLMRNNIIIISFLMSAGVASILSFIIGINKLRGNDNEKKA